MTISPPTQPPSTRQWLMEKVCPFWQARIVDAASGFFESMDESGEAGASTARTVLNQARLTYVFSHAAVLGHERAQAGADSGAGMLATATHGFNYLQRVSARDVRAEGWRRSTTVSGDTLDAARDAYDQAFVIFAMAWYHRASGSAHALALAEQTWDFMALRLADETHGGFFEEYPQTGKLPRRQNPHMHLLEAVLAMHVATGESRWLERAGVLVALFASVFFDPATGSLAEYFDARWQLAADAPGRLREPGHQFEWVWLLRQYARQNPPAPGAREATDARLDLLGARLFDFGTRHGLDASGPLRGLAFDAVGGDGSVLTPSKLLWPQTEYIKACIARYETTGDETFKSAAIAHLALTRRHFFYEGGAHWVNHVSRTGEHLVAGTPSRVLYHLFLAAAELIRIEEN